MLPDILKIAEENMVSIDSRTYDKKETMAQCPFCNSGKFHLSLNQSKNIFKCWHCSKSGGVLQFESLLTGKPFNEIRSKYFGKKKANKHPAHDLSPEQLKQIGWHDKKRDSYNAFTKSEAEVLNDWRKYEYEELVKHYALFILIANYPFKELQKEQYQWFLKEVKKSKVEGLKDTLIQAYQNNSQDNWVLRGIELADVSYKACVGTSDINFINIYTNVLFAIEIMKVQKMKRTA